MIKRYRYIEQYIGFCFRNLENYKYFPTNIEELQVILHLNVTKELQLKT